MSENPFGEGGFDLSAMLEQAQQMQAQLMDAQAKLAQQVVQGTAGGLVTVKLTGAGELTGVDIKAGSFDGNDADALADLGDLIVAAYRDAKNKADGLAQQALGPLAGGLGDPGAGGLGGFGGPSGEVGGPGV
ncbi:MAG: Nucleoid-associated protein [Marmoricola sp.]|jgi:DNA-binding YbaB/EbfC family protein|nr:Nucleoid-associated protein [Marmoricola sp.]